MSKKDTVFLYIFIFIEILLLINSKIVTKSVVDSTYIFIMNIFPSMFLNILIGNLLIEYNISYIIPKIIKNTFKKVFNFNEIECSIFIMSLITGAPSNAIFINEYLKSNQINERQAEKLICTTHFVNPLFIISCSNLLFNNSYIGIIMITIMVLENLCKAWILRDKYQKVLSKHLKNNDYFINNLKNAINKAFKASLMILGIIIVFNILSVLIRLIFRLNGNISIIINGLLEMSNGIIKLNNSSLNIYLKMILMYIFLNNGGLSIWMQSFGSIENKKIRFFKYLIFRII